MTKYLMCVFGTPGGDLGPGLAISRELRRRGHRVTIASHESYRAAVARQGFEFIGLLPAMDVEEGGQWFEYAAESHLKEYTYLFRDLVIPNSTHNLNRLSRNTDFDVLLCSQGSFFAPLLAEKRGKAWGIFFHQPLPIGWEYSRTVIIGRTWRTKLLRRVTLPKLATRLRTVMCKLAFASWMTPIKTARKSLGLPKIRGSFVVDTLHRSPHFNFALFPTMLATPADDWQQPLIQTAFVWNPQDDVPVSNRVLEFLAKGEPPLLFSLGNFRFATTRGREFFESAVKACASAGRRAIFVVGQNRDLGGGHENGKMVFSEYEPFPQLLPCVSMLVHTGGMGTIAEGLRAGIPQLLVPFSYEQCDNALRLQGLGLSRTLPIARCEPSSLAREISLLEADGYRNRAEEVKASVKDGDGAREVADHLERFS